MGGEKDLIESGGFKEQKFEHIATTTNGIKVLRAKSGDNKTPTYSNTPGTMYAKSDRQGKVNQVSVYGRGGDGRGKMKDIEMGHNHRNKINGKTVQRFKPQQIHVQEYSANGQRKSWARKPSKKERRIFMLARYGGQK